MVQSRGYMIFIELWSKNDFFILITNSRSFGRNVNTKRLMAQKRFFHSDRISLNCCFFCTYGIKNIDVLQWSMKVKRLRGMALNGTGRISS